MAGRSLVTALTGCGRLCAAWESDPAQTRLDRTGCSLPLSIPLRYQLTQMNLLVVSELPISDEVGGLATELKDGVLGDVSAPEALNQG